MLITRIYDRYNFDLLALRRSLLTLTQMFLYGLFKKQTNKKKSSVYRNKKFKVFYEKIKS